MATPVKFQAEVSRVTDHGDGVATYEFRYLDRRPRYKPGQFLHLALDAYDPARHWPESRVFTIAKGATDRAFIRLTIARKGPFTRRIQESLAVGSRVWMKAPYGEFIVEATPDREAVMIAGGTGVTPFVAFMEDALVRGIGGPAALHYGARTADLLVFRELAERCVADIPGFWAFFYAEDAGGEPDGIRPGRLDLARVLGEVSAPETAVFYLCGPEGMVEGVSGRLKDEFGVDEARVRVDAWA